uniref:NHL domain-containing protein n=1 Tax=Davidia involucrata TaxID=16924 RepID=A0A5B7A8F5_DAVIN
MGRKRLIAFLIFVVLFGGLSSASATPPAKIVSGVVSNVVSALFKWLWSLKSSTKTAISSGSLMKFEGGYTVETVFDGSKLGIDPYSIEISPTGELLVLDSENSNIYQISAPLSRYSRPKLIAGSPEGYSGHVDGKPRAARMNNPKGITVDARGNIYVADTLNMAIRKISDAGVVTIAGGKWGRGGGHVDGPSEDAKFSNDFDVVYIGSSCSLLVVDRGNQAIREIQLYEDDCAYQYDGNLHLGIAVLIAAGFFGYMLALLQRRVGAMFSSPSDPRTAVKKGIPPAPYQRPLKSVRGPIIPAEEESEKPEEEGLFGSLGRLFLNSGTSVFEIFGGLFSGFRKKPLHQQHYQQPTKHSNAWPMQESFVIPDEDDEPPSIETRTPTSRKSYPFMAKDMEKTHHFKQSRPFHGGWNGEFHHQQQQQHLWQQQQQQHHQRHYSSSPQTYYEQSCETNEIVFGAVQEQDGRREAVVIKAVDYGDPIYNNHNIRSRYNYMGYSYGY